MVRVDDVYQKVLAIANKEQRGYITPQEFNLFADYAQMEIFKQYFYDLEQFERRTDDTRNLVEDKISMFTALNVYATSNTIDLNDIDDFYKVIQVTKQFTTNYTGGVAQQIRYEDYHEIMSSKLTMPTKTRPVFFIKDHKIHIYPQNTVDMENGLRYFRTPLKPNWTYIISNQNALYNPSAAGHQDFELHASEENNLVINVLKLAGISIKDFNLTQVAAQEEIKTTQQQKQ